MEIDIVINDFEMGGAQMNWLRLLSCKSQNNFFNKNKIRLISLKKNNDLSLIKKLPNNVKFIEIKISKSNFLIKIFKLYKLLYKNDITICTLQISILLINLIFLFNNKKILNYHHSFYKVNIRPYFFFKILILNILKKNNNIFVSKYQYKNYQEKTNIKNMKGVVINNLFENINTKKNIIFKPKNTNVFRFIFVGRSHKVKNINFLIKIYTYLYEQNKNYELRVVCPNLKVKEFEILQKLNVDIIANELDLKKYYKQSDCLIITSEAETFGNVYMEAILEKCFILTSDTKGISEIIGENQTEIVNFKYNDIKSFINKLKFLPIFNNEDIKLEIDIDKFQHIIIYNKWKKLLIA